MINLKNFDSSWLKIDKKHCKKINIYYTGFITIKKTDDCDILKKKNGNKYLIFHDSANENKELLKNMQMFRWN